jgi:ectoine hydroxylase-related dioxygenase (phytanoyl-CoA dioxygenase family)
MSDDIVKHFGANPDFYHDEAFINQSKAEVVPWFPMEENVEVFNQVNTHQKLDALTEAVLGLDWQNLYCMVMFSKAGTVGQAWHQDCPPDDATQFNLNRLIYTDDVTDDIGGEVMVVPGSHRMGEIIAGDPMGALENEILIRPKKGSLLLLHGHTFHKVCPVKTKYRFSINYRCAGKGVPKNVTNICVYRNMKYNFELARVIEDRLV